MTRLIAMDAKVCYNKMDYEMKGVIVMLEYEQYRLDLDALQTKITELRDSL